MSRINLTCVRLLGWRLGGGSLTSKRGVCRSSGMRPSQQGQGQGPAPGEEQPQVPVQAGGDLLESSSAERDWECWGTTG